MTIIIVLPTMFQYKSKSFVQFFQVSSLPARCRSAHPLKHLFRFARHLFATGIVLNYLNNSRILKLSIIDRHIEAVFSRILEWQIIKFEEQIAMRRYPV